MVTTRRGSQRQDSTEALQGSGATTSSQRGRGTAGRGRGRSAARAAPVATEAIQLRPIGEDGSHVGTAQTHDLPPELIDGVTTDEAPGDEITGDQQPSLTAAEAPTGGGVDQGSESPGASSGSDAEDGDDDDDEDDDASDDDALFGPNLMDQLALSLKDALQARAGGQDALPPAQQAGTSGQKLGITSDPMAIRWQPEVAEAKTLRQDASRRMKPGAGVVKEKGLTHQLLAPPRVKAEEHASSSESKRWFQLPATKITDEVKQELRLLRLRGAYDPKRFYKSLDDTKFPKHFQIGTVLDNPQDFYSSRLTARERGASITQELLADPAVAASRKKRYAKLQQEATRFQKVKKRKTDLVRANPKPKRPKH